MGCANRVLTLCISVMLQNLLCHYVTVIKSWVTLEALFLLENSKQTPTAYSCATRWKMSAQDISTGTDSSQPWLKCYWRTSKTVQLYHCIKKFLISVYEKKAEMQIGVKLNQITYYTMYFFFILKAHMNAFHYYEFCDQSGKHCVNLSTLFLITGVSGQVCSPLRKYYMSALFK